MKDLSLVLESFSLVLGSCSADSKFATFLSVFATLLQRYKEFLKPPNFFAIIIQKFANFFVFGTFLTERLQIGLKTPV